MIAPLCKDGINSGNTFASCIDIVFTLINEALVNLVNLASRRKRRNALSGWSFLLSLWTSVYFQRSCHSLSPASTKHYAVTQSLFTPPPTPPSPLPHPRFHGMVRRKYNKNLRVKTKYREGTATNYGHGQKKDSTWETKPIQCKQQSHQCNN